MATYSVLRFINKSSENYLISICIRASVSDQISILNDYAFQTGVSSWFNVQFHLAPGMNFVATTFFFPRKHFIQIMHGFWSAHCHNFRNDKD